MDAIETLLLRRQYQVFPGGPSGRAPAPAKAVEALEQRLLDLGFVVSRELGQAFRALPLDLLTAIGPAIEKTLAEELGADRPHVPLFRSFPRLIPRNTRTLYVRRVITYLVQNPRQPCLWCGKVDTVHALDPCGHLVCSACWDGANYSACPICYRRLAHDEPFLKAVAPAAVVPGSKLGDPGFTLKLLHLGDDPQTAAARMLQGLLTRATPLSPQDRKDLELLLAALGPAVLPALPAEIPVKETSALVLGTLLRDPGSIAATLAAAAPHLKTATDVLRVLSVWMGGEADLLKPPKLRSPSRALRRGFLAALERLPPHLVSEDLLRHAGLWKRLGAQLHPFEHHKQYPNTALAFAVLRRSTPAANNPLRDTIDRAAAAHPESFHPVAATLRFRGWAGHLEHALRSDDLESALRLLGQRPGELLRRLDHLLRRVSAAAPDLLPQVLTRLSSATPAVSPALLMTALAQLRVRTAPLPRRVFFPRGNVLKAFGITDTRASFSDELIDAVTPILELELLRRAATLPAFPAAVIDAGLVDLVVPFNERTASRSLVAVPRGSNLPIPADQRMRLFLHWTQPEDERVDLDLSVAMFDERWQYVGLCDFTSLVFSEHGATHSGDLTSAPPPLGASEFVDLDSEVLEMEGVRYLVVVIFSYNNVPFDHLPDAFAGFMLRAEMDDKHFDARTVAQRFDLQGDAKVAVPMIVDLSTKRMRWVDTKMSVGDRFHDIGSHCGALAHLGLDFTAYFGSGARMNMWELACLHAAARCPDVHVRRRDGAIDLYHRGADESHAAFFRRLVDGEAPDAGHAALPDTPALLALLRDDLTAADGSEGYALRWNDLSPTLVRRLAASELIAALARPT